MSQLPTARQPIGRWLVWGDVPDDKRAQLESACANARTHLRSNVELDAMEDGATVMEKLLRSSVGKERANVVDSYTAVFHDPKLSGEPTHRPNIRTAPLRAEYGHHINKVSTRFQAELEALPVGDAYFLFDNGKTGNSCRAHEAIRRPGEDGEAVCGVQG